MDSDTLVSNKALLLRHFDEVLNQGRIDAIDTLYAETYVLDAPVQTSGSVHAHGRTDGRDGLKRRVLLFRTAFPDIHFTTDRPLAEDDRVAVQYTFEGTHTGQFGELAPAGRRIRVAGMLIAKVNAGQIQSAVSVFDSGDLFRQMAPDTQGLLRHTLDALTALFRHHPVA